MGDRELFMDYARRERGLSGAALDTMVEAMLENAAQRSAEQVAYNAMVRSDGYKNWPYHDKPV